MTFRLFKPRNLTAEVQLPASKSISNRALILNALSGGNVGLLSNVSDCDDTAVMLAALSDLPAVIDIKAAGTAMRFLTALMAVTPGQHTLTGSERMRHRPIGVLVEALRQLGAEIAYDGEEGFPPLTVTGARLRGGDLQLAGNVSSQYISALLMIGPMLKEGLTLQLTGDIISRPYIDLTLWTMREFSAEAEWSSADTITGKPVPYKSRE